MCALLQEQSWQAGRQVQARALICGTRPYRSRAKARWRGPIDGGSVQGVAADFVRGVASCSELGLELEPPFVWHCRRRRCGCRRWLRHRVVTQPPRSAREIRFGKAGFARIWIRRSGESVQRRHKLLDAAVESQATADKERLAKVASAIDGATGPSAESKPLVSFLLAMAQLMAWGATTVSTGFRWTKQLRGLLVLCLALYICIGEMSYTLLRGPGALGKAGLLTTHHPAEPPTSAAVQPAGSTPSRTRNSSPPRT